MSSLEMHQWNPGLLNDHLTLQEVINSLPGYEQKAIHFLVRLFENPSSPFAMKGAISLPRHDAVHIALGRGILPQDEAFVIGFTMGTAKDIAKWEVWLYEMISKYLYPEEYTFTDAHISVYKLGLACGKESNVHQIYDFPFEDYHVRTLEEIRQILGIDKAHLCEAYAKECALISHSEESKRLALMVQNVKLALD